MEQERREWVISNTYFDYVDYEVDGQKSFRSAAEKDAYLIQAWNSVVADEDTIYILGGFSFSKDKEYLHSIVSRLKGYKILITGRTDKLTDMEYILLGFNQVFHEFLFPSYKCILIADFSKGHKIEPDYYYIVGENYDRELPFNMKSVSAKENNYIPMDLFYIRKYLLYGNKEKEEAGNPDTHVDPMVKFFGIMFLIGFIILIIFYIIWLISNAFGSM